MFVSHRTLLAIVLAAPIAARAEVRLLDDELRPPDLRTFAFVQQDGRGSGEKKPGSQGGEKQPGTTQDGEKQPATPGTGKDTANGSLDFDLLGEAKAPPVPPEDRVMKRRRRMLGIHQTVGIGLYSLQVATTVVGQLNYNDKFGDANTGRYKLPHQVLAYSTVALFAANGALALLAPEAPGQQGRGFDRVALHKVSMFTAAAGMAAQVALGIYTARREGFENKQDFGRVHLIVGYATLAAMTAGVAAIVF